MCQGHGTMVVSCLGELPVWGETGWRHMQAQLGSAVDLRPWAVRFKFKDSVRVVETAGVRSFQEETVLYSKEPTLVWGKQKGRGGPRLEISLSTEVLRWN